MKPELLLRRPSNSRAIKSRYLAFKITDEPRAIIFPGRACSIAICILGMPEKHSYCIPGTARIPSSDFGENERLRTQIKEYLHDLMDFVDESLVGADELGDRQAHLRAAFGGYSAIRHRLLRESPFLYTQFDLLDLYDKSAALANLTDAEYQLAAVDIKKSNRAFREVIQSAPLDLVNKKPLREEEP